ncbi:DUF342 domain-containing protein [Sedimentibacter sp. zth1]|uniref:DUF342 domain-containing protein n=1 Tax=Sedimentibacter sp. zth1 TaxID=2816908 RepID=UPI001A915706|nr:FapA family protein [Sedimentibacter sp. zth1]QSX07180.1 DUF342 domain-containing protein [Sedimentibacter sp. zth1]
MNGSKYTLNESNIDIKEESTKENKTVDNVQKKGDEQKYILDIVVSVNKLKAYLRVRLLDKSVEINHEEILQKLKELDIVYGINENDIKEFCEKKEYFKELIVAEGLIPINEKNAYLKYNFDIDNNIQFTEKKDGSIDFKNINAIKSVEKDGLLCTKIPIELGKNGFDIFGKEVPHNKARDVGLPTGKNTYVSEDGLKLYANVSGCIYKKANSVDVDNVYTVKCVDHRTGNIDFLGSVLIKEDVKAGFTVKAKNNITVKGMVEGATLEAGGDITISNGMNGRDVGKISAGGNITSKYLENSIVCADKNIYSCAIINCNVNARQSIILKGARATIIGGECIAGEIIQAKTIGTKNNIQTKIVIDLNKYFNAENLKSKNKQSSIKIEKEIKKQEDSLKQLEEKIKMLLPYIKKSPENEKIYKYAILKKVEQNKDIGLLKAKLLEQKEENKKISDHKILCSGIIYANTRISIGWLKYVVREDLSYSKLYNDGSDIQITPLLPSELSAEG